MPFRRHASSSASRGWVILVVALLVAIVAPFVLFEGAMLRLAERALDPGHSRSLTAAALIVLLAGDSVLPVPSSIVSTAAGALLGFLWGTVASAIGMTLGCLGGYLIGYRYGRPAATALVGASEIARAEATVAAVGAFALVFLRPVPVLAEASVISAGALRIPFTRVCLAVSIANVALSAWYAAVGAAVDEAGVVLVFLGALVLPATALLVQMLFRRSRKRDPRALPGPDSIHSDS